jgi:lipopolysaccharide/colanic/teichoic acid biosynthesis glycosyltransferase
MSLVGPRPLATASGAFYRARVASDHLRNARPGLVSWAQVNEGRDDISNGKDRLHCSIEDDCYYLANRSFRFDMKILFLALFSTGTYA